MNFLILFFLVLFSGCATSGMHRNYIISQSSEEIEEEASSKSP